MIQKIEQNLKRASRLNNFLSSEQTHLTYYEIVHVVKNGSDYKKGIIDSLECNVTLAFSDKSKALEHGNEVIAIMLGKLVEEIKSDKVIRVIGINLEKETNYFSQFIFVPFLDGLTQLNLISPTDESIALLSIDQEAHRHMGVEASFFSINNKFLPEEPEAREIKLAETVEDMSFIIPRLTSPKGSANIICLILNLENAIEEKAFIRTYKTTDRYTEVLFVTSDLKLQTGDLEQIIYDGSNLEGIYTPIIKRHKLN
jgi:hypothetical protein